MCFNGTRAGGKLLAPYASTQGQVINHKTQGWVGRASPPARPPPPNKPLNSYMLNESDPCYIIRTIVWSSSKVDNWLAEGRGVEPS